MYRIWSTRVSSIFEASVILSCVEVDFFSLFWFLRLLLLKLNWNSYTTVPSSGRVIRYLQFIGRDFHSLFWNLFSAQKWLFLKIKYISDFKVLLLLLTSEFTFESWLTSKTIMDALLEFSTFNISFNKY